MLASVVKATFEEIAFEGPPGISWSSLCARLRDRDIIVDDLLRAELWKQCIARKNEIIFRDAHGKELHEVTEEAPADDEMRDGTPQGELKRPKGRMRKKSRLAAPSGKDMLLDVSQELRYRLLHIAPHPELTDNSTIMKAFQAISRSRSQGAWAVLLALDLGIIPRDIFYQLEGLRLAGLVLSINANMPREVLKEYNERAQPNLAGQQACHSNLLFHARFYNAEKIESAHMQMLIKNAEEPLSDRMLQAISASKSKVVFEGDLRGIANEVLLEQMSLPVSGRTAGRLYQKVRKQLHDQKKVEFVRAWDACARVVRDGLCEFGAHPPDVLSQTALALKDDPTTAGIKATVSGMVDTSQALDSCNSATPDEDEEELHAVESEACAGLSATVNDSESATSVLVSERPLFVQTVDIIACSGVVGLTSPEIADLLNLQRKSVERLLNDLIKTRRVVKLMESDGKMHVNRYLSKSHAPKMPSSSAASRLGSFAKSTWNKRGAASAGKSSGKVGRVDSTFKRRIKRALELVEERHVLTALDFRRILQLDGGVEGKYFMDRRTAQRVMEAASKIDKRFKTAHGYFAYWSPALSEKDAVLRVEEQYRQRKAERWQGIQGDKKKIQTLAITDEPPPVSTALIPLVPDISTLSSTTNNRRLLTDVTVTSIRRTNEQRGNQKIQTFYGYQAPVMVRVQLLHELLTQSFLDGRDWNAKQVVDEMEVQVFLQVVGCGAQNDYIDKLLRSGSCKPKLQSLPPHVYQTLMNTTYSPQRAQHVVRRLLAHLVKLRLVTTTSSTTVGADSIGDQSVPESSHQSVEKSRGGVGRSAPRFGGYRLCRHAELFSFSRSETEDPPKQMGSYDFAQPNAFTQYWKQLQELSEAWMAKTAKTGQNASNIQSSRENCKGEDQSDASDGATEVQLEHEKDGLAGSKSQSPTLPVNSKLPELFHKKNWKHKAWLTPDQRVAIVDFVHEVMADVPKKSMLPDARAPPAESTALALRSPPRVLTPRSPQIVALSRRIGVSPDRIIKHCKQISELQKTGLCDAAGEQHVVFTALCSVRYRCHICFHLCCQRNAIEEHYHNEHGTELPEDESVYCDEEFQMHRLEQAKETRATNERRRRRRVRSRPNAGGSSSSGDAAVPILPPHILPHESQKPVKQLWGDAPGDETEWLRLLVVAELLVAQKQGEEFSCQDDAVSAEVWPTLATLTGRSIGHCRRRIRKLLRNDKKNNRTVNVLRSRNFQPAVAKQGPIVGGALWAMARSVAKTLLLTPHRAHEPWWRSDIFAYNVNELVEWVFRQWQMERLVCKFKPTTHSERLPETSKPHYLLTWEARLRLFGRLNEVVRWYECLGQTQLASQSNSKLLVTEANGSLVQLLSDLMANDEVSLTPVWQDTDFYEKNVSEDGEIQAPNRDTDDESLGLAQSEASNQALQEDSDLENANMEELKDGSEDTEHMEEDTELPEHTHKKFGKYGGVRAHLKLTKDTPNIEGVGVVVATESQSLLKSLPARREMISHDAASAKFLEWIKVTSDELSNLASVESEPIDPILLEHVMLSSNSSHIEAQPQKSSDKSGRSRIKAVAEPENVGPESALEAKETAPSRKRRKCSATLRKCALGLPATSEHEASSDIDAFKEFAKRLHASPGIRDAASLLDMVAFLLKVILAHMSADGVRSCSLSHLRERFRGQFDLAGEDAFLAAVACLEELRLVVPFACGPEFCEVLATDAAPFCFTREPSQRSSSCTSDDIFSLCKGFTVGRHWRCNPLPSDKEWNLMTQATRAVAERAGAGTSKASVVRLMLPRGLVAPAFMLEATTSANSSVLRFLCLRFLMQVAKTPGASAAELACQSGILDECEAQLLLKAMCEVGALEASGVSSCSEDAEAHAFFLRPMSA